MCERAESDIDLVTVSQVYRSGYPNEKNFPFLRKLGIRTVVYLCPEDYLEPNRKALEAQQVKILQVCFGVCLTNV